jgi:CBS domain-containing protein
VNRLSYCWKCGTKLDDKDKYCSVCGAEARKVTQEEFTVSSDDLIERVKQLLHEGNVTRIIVKDEKGRTLLEIPVFSLSNVCWYFRGLAHSFASAFLGLFQYGDLHSGHLLGCGVLMYHV